MTIKIPPPPQFTGPQWQSFNRWLLELTSILNNTGGIDPSEVSGLSEVITQVGTNTADIATLDTTTGGQGTNIATLNSEVAAINSQISIIGGDITALQSNAVVHNGTSDPASGFGRVGDWFANTSGGAGHRIFVKTGVSAWTAFPF
jgi:hypothetical protein